MSEHRPGGVGVYWALKSLAPLRPCPQVLLLGPAQPWHRDTYHVALDRLTRTPGLVADVYVPIPEVGSQPTPDGWLVKALRRSTHVLFWFEHKQTVAPIQIDQLNACLEDTRRTVVVVLPPHWLRSAPSPRADHPVADRLFREGVARHRAGYAPLVVCHDMDLAIGQLTRTVLGRPPLVVEV